MPYIQTTATKKVAAMRKRIRAVPGGTSASKTVSILMDLVDLAQTDKRPTLTSTISESFPHLKRGAIKDFLDIMGAQDYFVPKRWNKTDYFYTFETGSKLEFFSADQPAKVRGPRRDRAFINEANNVPFETFEQLEIRTNEFMFLDWNPTNEFWYYTEVKGKRDDVEELTLTYLDNEGLPEAIRRSIEQRRHRKGWWKVYGEGELGEVEGKIYSGWQIVDEVPHEAKLLRYWLDFGYSIDPTSIGAIYAYNGGFILHEICYRKGMSNKQIADLILSQEAQALVIADSAEPKSIDEIAGYGVMIIPAEKGPDSVRNGIQVVQAQRISVTKQSPATIKEYRNYLWEVDKNGIVLPVPEEGFNHSMDGIRYGITNIVKVETGDEEQERADRLLKRLKKQKAQTR